MRYKKVIRTAVCVAVAVCMLASDSTVSNAVRSISEIEAEQDSLQDVDVVFSRRLVVAWRLQVLPQVQLPTLEIDKATAGAVTVLQFLADCVEGLATRMLQFIDRTMLTTQIATVQDEDNTLQWCATTQ